MPFFHGQGSADKADEGTQNVRNRCPTDQCGRDAPHHARSVLPQIGGADSDAEFQEERRICEKREERPKFDKGFDAAAQESPAGTTRATKRHAGHQRGQHPRRLDLIRRQKRAIRDGQGNQHLREVVVCMGQQQEPYSSSRNSDRNTAENRPYECECRWSRLKAFRDSGHQGSEQDQGDAVIEEALTLK